MVPVAGLRRRRNQVPQNFTRTGDSRGRDPSTPRAAESSPYDRGCGRPDSYSTHCGDVFRSTANLHSHMEQRGRGRVRGKGRETDEDSSLPFERVCSPVTSTVVHLGLVHPCPLQVPSATYVVENDPLFIGGLTHRICYS